VYQTDNDVRMQHVLNTGTIDPGWYLGGVVLPSHFEYDLSLSPDGAGGALVAWSDAGAVDTDVFSAHVLSTGSLDPAWTGTDLTPFAGDQSDPRIVGDGVGGAFLSWTDTREGQADVYVQHLASNGQSAQGWPVGGYSVGVPLGPRDQGELVEDGQGGALVVWADRRSGDSDIYSHHVISTGLDSAWPVGGRALCLAQNDQVFPAIVGDGAGGAICTWMDYRSSTDPDIYSQRVGSNGLVNVGWPTGGRALTTAVGSQVYPRLISDGRGGAIATWQTYNGNSGSRVAVQMVHANGDLDFHWPVSGRLVSTAPGQQWAPALVSDLQGGALIAWQDTRDLGNVHVYAQRVDSSSYLGPAAVGVEDASSGPQLILGRPVPSPMRDRMSISIRVQSTTTLRVDVLDSGGRRVRALHEGTAGPGSFNLSWDGRDASGSPAAPGLYFLRAVSSAGARSKRLVVLR
jgi:hypothetical protein